MTDRHVDEYTIRLDCTAQWLSEHRQRFSVCGVRLATEHDVSATGYLEGAVIPQFAESLTPADLDLLTAFLADADTPTGLRLEFGEARLPDGTLAQILEEAQNPDFQPHYGSTYAVGPYKGRLIDVLTAQPNTLTTTKLDPRIPRYSETRSATWVGMHYDNALTTSGQGERFPAAMRVAEADRRVLYNIGPGPRRLVVALTVTAVHLAEKVRPGDGEHIPDSRQLLTYLNTNPNEIESVLCLVVTLPPGSFIVFPAGVAMHDGSMDGLPEPSSAVVLGGKF